MTQRKKEIFHSISPFFYSPFNEKDAQIDKLHIELRLIEKELAETKARLSHYEPKTEEAKEHPKGLGTAKDASTKKPSSPNADNAASATAQ